jgi:hypothetical protein
MNKGERGAKGEKRGYFYQGDAENLPDAIAVSKTSFSKLAEQEI